VSFSEQEDKRSQLLLVTSITGREQNTDFFQCINDLTLFHLAWCGTIECVFLGCWMVAS
jgi:hypothetical protein